MNLIEITKGCESKQNEQTEQMKSLPDITDKWKQLAKEQVASLELVTEERDELQVRNQKVNEFIQKFQERTHKLKMEKQKLFFENHEMQDEIHRLTIELSEKQKLNQSLQQSNDDLRNRNGLMSRSEQEKLEEEIKDVRDQNSKLQDNGEKVMKEQLTEEQKKFLTAEGKVVVKACPGSGKTYSVAHKLLSYIDNWKDYHSGVAVLSFTNVASNEIQEKAQTIHGSLGELGYPHFIGTVDSFIDEFIVLRYGHLDTVSNVRPRITITDGVFIRLF